MTAQEQYTKLVTNVTTLTSTCAMTLQRIQCLAVFNACEMGTPETLCRTSCIKAVEAECTATLVLEMVQVAACGGTTSPRDGVSDEGLCFETTYDGPEKAIWVIGFIIAVVFSFLASVGINLQKKALKQNALMAEPKPAYRLPLWILGFVLCLVGSLLDFVAFGLAPQSLLAPLAALTLVWNMLLAPCFNKEKLSRNDIMSTLIIFIGDTIAVVFASHTSPSYSLDMLMQLYRDPLTIGYFCMVCLIMAANFAAIKIAEGGLCLMHKRRGVIPAGTPARWATIRLVGYAGLAGILGGQSVLFAKSSAELLKGVLNGDASCFMHYQTYIIVLALIVCMRLQIKYLNGGLLHYDALSMVPVYQAYWVISGVLGGVIYFQEIRTFSVLQVIMFVLGIGISIFGVVLLSHRKHAPSVVSKTNNIERCSSFTSSLDLPKNTDLHLITSVPESASTSAFAVEQDCIDTSRELVSTIVESLNGEHKTATFDVDDRRSENEALAHINRQAIDNYLDMSKIVPYPKFESFACEHYEDGSVTTTTCDAS